MKTKVTQLLPLALGAFRSGCATQPEQGGMEQQVQAELKNIKAEMAAANNTIAAEVAAEEAQTSAALAPVNGEDITIVSVPQPDYTNAEYDAERSKILDKIGEAEKKIQAILAQEKAAIADTEQAEKMYDAKKAQRYALEAEAESRKDALASTQYANRINNALISSTTIVADLSDDELKQYIEMQKTALTVQEQAVAVSDSQLFARMQDAKRNIEFSMLRRKQILLEMEAKKKEFEIERLSVLAEAKEKIEEEKMKFATVEVAVKGAANAQQTVADYTAMIKKNIDQFKIDRDEKVHRTNGMISKVQREAANSLLVEERAIRDAQKVLAGK